MFVDWKLLALLQEVLLVHAGSSNVDDDGHTARLVGQSGGHGLLAVTVSNLLYDRAIWREFKATVIVQLNLSVKGYDPKIDSMGAQEIDDDKD